MKRYENDYLRDIYIYQLSINIHTVFMQFVLHGGKTVMFMKSEFYLLIDTLKHSILKNQCTIK